MHCNNATRESPCVSVSVSRFAPARKSDGPLNLEHTAQTTINNTPSVPEQMAKHLNFQDLTHAMRILLSKKDKRRYLLIYKTAIGSHTVVDCVRTNAHATLELENKAVSMATRIDDVVSLIK